MDSFILIIEKTFAGIFKILNNDFVSLFQNVNLPYNNHYDEMNSSITIYGINVTMFDLLIGAVIISCVIYTFSVVVRK